MRVKGQSYDQAKSEETEFFCKNCTVQQPETVNQEKSLAEKGAVLVTAFNRPDLLKALLDILKPFELRI